MKKEIVLTRKELNEYIDKQANIIIENMLKNKKKISENRKRLNTTERLTNRISESIMQKMGLHGSMNESRQHISEAGHLYGHYEDGTPFTNSKDTWRGVKGTTFISHGEWSDPEIWYKGKELNASDIEDGLWSWYEEECSENNEQPTQQGYEQWLETQDLVGYLDDVLFGMSESKKRNSSKYINETIEYDDYGSISDALAQCGWAYSDCYDVHNRNTGQNGIRYIIEPYPNNLEGIKPMDVDEMKEKMVALLGQENVIFSEGQHRQAPEIKNLSMVVF